MGRPRDEQEVAETFIGRHPGEPVRIRDVGEVVMAPKEKRGEASIWAAGSVLLTIQKQPGRDTVTLTRAIDGLPENLAHTTPPGRRFPRPADPAAAGYGSDQLTGGVTGRSGKLVGGRVVAVMEMEFVPCPWP